MKWILTIAALLCLACGAQASWYWPFGEDGILGHSQKRLSELMEPASMMIDEAADLADEGKTNESIEKYREVLKELDRLERENPDRADTPEFSTVRNKRAYVNAKINAMLMNQVRVNARVVAVSDTRELEEKQADERWEKSVAAVRAVKREKDETAAGTLKSLKDALKKASQMCSNDVQLVVTCEAGAAKLCEFESFDRAGPMLDLAYGKLVKMPVTTNATQKARLKAGLREVKNVLAFLSMSSRTNDVAFCAGLEKTIARVDRVSKESDRVVGRKVAAKPAVASASSAPKADRVDAIVPTAPKTNRVNAVAAAAPKPAARSASRPLSRREQAIDDIARGDYAAAELVIREMLRAKPNSALALNLKAAMEMKQGKLREAEETLDRAIANNGRSHFAYYNMARLMLRKNADDKSRAQKYYDTGRAYGGPKDPQLEALLK